MRTKPVDILRHPILQEATNVCHAIEECGASEKLTQAVIKASELINSIDDLLNEFDTKGGRVGAVVSGKNGVEFKFTFGDKVWINDLQCYGRILSCWHTRSGKQYELRYFVDGKHETSYLFEDELSEKKP